MPASIQHGFLKPRINNRVHAKIKSADILGLFQQLATLFRSGTPIYEALTVAAEQCQSTKLGAVIKQVAEKVSAGTQLNVSMSEFPEQFKAEWIEIIRSGEDSGQLGTVLDQLADRIDAAVQLRSKIISAMMYPCILACVATGAMTIMLLKVVPTFQSMFKQMDQELPEITLAVLAVSEFLQEYFGILFVTIAGTVFGLWRWMKTENGRTMRDKLFVSMPLIGTITVNIYMQKFANSITLSLNAGMPLMDAVSSLQGLFRQNAIYRQSLEHVSRLVQQGERFADSLESTNAFTLLVVRMTRIGEQTGNLPAVMEEVGTYYKRRVETVVTRVTGSMETVIILFMGLGIAVILCAIYLPMFSMASGVH